MLPMKKTDEQIALPFVEEAPATYMPRLQLFIRMMLGVLSLGYFYFLPISSLILSYSQILLIAYSYMMFHMCWWVLYKRYGIRTITIRIGAWVDILGASVALFCDPFTIPPMAILFLIAVLGNGMQHGIHVFVESMYGAFILGGAGLLVHFFLLGINPPYNMYFYVLLIIVGIFYSYILVKRIEHMKENAVEMSERDGLTGILNRRAFVKVAEYLLTLHERTHIPLVFVFGDLDNFKDVNDKLGHAMGDKVLQYFANMVREKLRKSDIVARYGGDEFIFILTNTTIRSAESLTLRLQTDFKQWARENGVSKSPGLFIQCQGLFNSRCLIF
jgi:diguanylate cyclase (GGDEF)-like protein